MSWLRNPSSRPLLQWCFQFWFPPVKKDVDRVERVPKRVGMMVRGMENLLWEEKLRGLSLFSLERRRF